MSNEAWQFIAVVLAACITGWGTVKVATLARRSSKESGDWERIEGLWGRVDTLEGKVRDLESQNRSQGGKIADLQGENRRHTDKIAFLERALDAARRYITQLVALLQAHDITPPVPPDDYTPR